MLERVSRELGAIFAGRDDRVIVMLRLREPKCFDADSLAWLARLRESYDSELELLLLLARSDGSDEPARLEPAAIEPIGLPLAAEVAQGSELGEQGPILLSTWSLCDGTRPWPPRFLDALLDPRSLGWLLPYRHDVSIERMAHDARLDACNLQRTVLDLGAGRVPSARLAQCVRTVLSELGSGWERPAGIAFDLACAGTFEASSQADDYGWHVDATEAVLDEVANAVMMRRIAAYTRSPMSLSTKL
ncbi:hypothetical protein D7S89_15650 [Trinickia fusca]|uniref:Uncharacterized protein n=2 Tax=Trinickia fusca TaxID=2419777 RepID=A0A494X9G9_9BURK|nr:hypothetical protein D7S89_15650 [Trinickia fusca]